MPVVVYIFTLSAFALGLAEFVPIGLTELVSAGLGVSVDAAGHMTTLYALGAALSAPLLSALTAGWPRKRAMLVTMLLFTAGSLAAALAPDMLSLNAARFVAGTGHGLFLAVAANAAAELAGPQKSGRAIAVVFGGFTVAMAVGVPASTWLGGSASWRVALGVVAVFGAIGLAGLAAGMRTAAPTATSGPASVRSAFVALRHPVLLGAALVTVLGYAGAFTVFTYIAPLLTGVTGLDAGAVSLFMLLFGVAAVAGNVLGGRLTDRLGAQRASALLIAGIAVLALGFWALASSPLAMAILVALLGALTFASVPALQARLLQVAATHAPVARGVASGLNIAGFNAGIAVGSLLGGVVLGQFGARAMGLAGAAISLLGLALLGALQMRVRQRGRDSGGSVKATS